MAVMQISEMETIIKLFNVNPWNFVLTDL